MVIMVSSSASRTEQDTWTMIANPSIDSVYPFNHESSKITYANSVDPHEITHTELSHQDPLCFHYVIGN